LAVLRNFQILCPLSGKNLRSENLPSASFALAEAQRRQVLLHFSFGNGFHSPDRSGNPFWGGVRPKKIEADSGKQLLIFIKIPIFKF